MSRSKHLQNTELCGDCGSIDAHWASINRGILLCTQCCSIHRHLGRHISQVKSLNKSIWHGKQLTMLNVLNNNGANNIWEHALLENNSKLMKKKPTARDPIEVKTEFIKAKHQHCAYVLRQNYEDGLLCVENELGKQLHASCRTPNLETSFKLLVLGADPNYFHDEKGSTPLHVATKSEQALQVELLLVYGADPTCRDALGATPMEYAKNFANKEIYYRLIENQYEVSDTFSYYLNGKKPDHKSGVHFLVPQNGFSHLSPSLFKLQKLSNKLFEELAVDVFDEVDRRQTEGIWLSCADAIKLTTVPFLPVDPTLSTTRNQGRQKLARFSTPELKNLVHDILVDTQRRQLLSEKGIMGSCSSLEDDPLYDTVASDEDYAMLPPIQENSALLLNTNNSQQQTSLLSKTSDPSVVQLNEKLRQSELIINELRGEINNLKTLVMSLSNENNVLKNKLQNNTNGENLNLNEVKNKEDNDLKNKINKNIMQQSVDDNFNVELRTPNKIQRPSSMYETREISNRHTQKTQAKKQSDLRNTTQSLYANSQQRQNIQQLTENITQSVKELFANLVNKKIDFLIPSAEKVKLSSARLLANLPKDFDPEITNNMLGVLPKLLPECTEFVAAYKNGDKNIEDQTDTNIRNFAFVLIKNTKDIVTKTLYS